jgi:hypothetical protein
MATASNTNAVMAREEERSSKTGDANGMDMRMEFGSPGPGTCALALYGSPDAAISMPLCVY